MAQQRFVMKKELEGAESYRTEVGIFDPNLEKAQHFPSEELVDLTIARLVEGGKEPSEGHGLSAFRISDAPELPEDKIEPYAEAPPKAGYIVRNNAGAAARFVASPPPHDEFELVASADDAWIFETVPDAQNAADSLALKHAKVIEVEAPQ